MRLAVAALFAVLFTGLAGCVMEEPSGQADAFTKTPKVETGNLSENEGCEIKGSGAYNPCKMGKPPLKGSNEDQDKFRKAMAVPYPSGCREVKFPRFDPDDSSAVFDKASGQVLATIDECQGYMGRISAIYGAGREKPKNMPSELEARWSKANDARLQSVANMQTYGDAALAYTSTLVLPPDRPEKSTSVRSSGGEGCANPFGGPTAPAGQFICSNQGELQACECSGGNCSLKPTGSFLCTSPGAVIR